MSAGSPVGGEAGLDASTDEPLANQLKFRISLPALIDCLCVFGVASLNATSMAANYSRSTGTLRLLLENAGTVTECELRTVDAHDELDFPEAFRRSNVEAKLLLRAEAMRDAFTTLFDTPGAMSVSFMVADDDSVAVGSSSSPPRLKLSTDGTAGHCSVAFDASSEAFLTSEVSTGQVWSYSISSLLNAVKALAHATECYIRINESGMLSMSHKLVGDDGQVSFVSLIVLADNEDVESVLPSSKADEVAATPAGAGISDSESSAAEAEALRDLGLSMGSKTGLRRSPQRKRALSRRSGGRTHASYVSGSDSDRGSDRGRRTGGNETAGRRKAGAGAGAGRRASPGRAGKRSSIRLSESSSESESEDEWGNPISKGDTTSPRRLTAAAAPARSPPKRAAGRTAAVGLFKRRRRVR